MSRITEPAANAGCYGRDTLEFSRVAMLSDAVFAIAMTLLVFTIEIPDLANVSVAAALRGQVPQFVAFALSFGLIAYFWVVHHRFFAELSHVEPLLVTLDLILLAAVALVPYPSSLIGQAPGDPIAAMIYIGVIGLLGTVHVLLLLRAQRAGLFRREIPRRVFAFRLGEWVSGPVLAVVALAVAWWLPILGLALLVLTWPIEAVIRAFAPEELADWL